MVAVVIPGPGSVVGIAPARDPGVRANAEDFGAQTGAALADLGQTLSSIGTHLNNRRQQAEDDLYVQRAQMEANKDIYSTYLQKQPESIAGPDQFYKTIDNEVNRVETEVPKRLQEQGGYRPSQEANRRVQSMFLNMRENYGTRALTDGNNARIGKLSTDLESSLSDVQAGAAEHGDFPAAMQANQSMLTTARTFLPPDEVEKLKSRVDTQMGQSAVSYLKKLQDDGLSAKDDEERETYVVQAEGLIDQAGANGWMSPADVADNKRIWAENYAKRVAGTMEPMERLRALGGAQEAAKVGPVDPSKYETKLAPNEEIQFQTWKAKYAPNDSGQDYDFRGAYRAGLVPAANGHWPDTFKKPNHPTFSNESQYAKDRPELAGHWDGDTYVPPNQRSIPAPAAALLNTISSTESPGYDVLNGGERFAGFADHPRRVGAGGSTTAAGRYQFVAGTWDRAAKALGLKDFSPESQDRAAWWLAQEDYRSHTGRQLLPDLLSGDPERISAIRKNLGATWKGLQGLSDTEFAKRLTGAATGTPSPFFEHLPADVRTQLRASAQAAVTRGQGEYMNGVDDYAAYLRAGNAPDGRYGEPELQNMLGPQKGSEVYQELQRSEAYGSDVSDTAMASPEELQAIVGRRAAAISSPEGFKENAQDLGGLEKAIAARDTAIAKDPALYVAQNDDRVRASIEGIGQDQGKAQDYAATTLAAQSVLGVPSDLQRILPEAQAQNIVRQFKYQPEGGQNAAQLMQGLEQQWGKYWPQVFGELSKDLPGTALVVGAMNRPGQERAAEKLAEAGNLGTKTLEDAVPDDARKPIKDELDATLQPFADTLRHSPGAARTYSAFKEGVYQLALTYAREGDASGALDRAYQDVLGKAYTMKDTYRVPAEVDADAVEAGAGDVLQHIDGVNWALPTSLAGLPEDQTRAAYLDSVRANGFWVTSPDESGLTLWDGLQPILTTEGKPVTATWQQLVGFAPKATPQGLLPRVQPFQVANPP